MANEEWAYYKAQYEKFRRAKNNYKNEKAVYEEDYVILIGAQKSLNSDKLDASATRMRNSWSFFSSGCRGVIANDIISRLEGSIAEIDECCSMVKGMMKQIEETTKRCNEKIKDLESKIRLCEQKMNYYEDMMGYIN